MRTTLSFSLSLLFRLTVPMVVLIPSPMAGQGSAAPTADTIFQRAQRLVNQGQGTEGRKLVDSVVAAAPAGSPRYAEALYWRAALALNAADAERDYRRIIVEFPLAPRAGDALISLAQLELTRREYPQAIEHLERLLREHPNSGAVPRAHFWLGRVHLEQGDLPRGCASLALASRNASASNVELRNQIDFHARRCLGVDAAGIAASDASTRVVTTPAATTASAPGPPPPASRPAEAASSPAPRRDSAAGSIQYTVQIAALNERAPAQDLADKLRARGYDARVVGAGQLFRVRIGRYPTREAATAVAAEMRQKGISRDAWVAEAEAR